MGCLGLLGGGRGLGCVFWGLFPADSGRPADWLFVVGMADDTSARHDVAAVLWGEDFLWGILERTTRPFSMGWWAWLCFLGAFSSRFREASRFFLLRRWRTIRPRARISLLRCGGWGEDLYYSGVLWNGRAVDDTSVLHGVVGLAARRWHYPGFTRCAVYGPVFGSGCMASSFLTVAGLRSAKGICREMPSELRTRTRSFPTRRTSTVIGSPWDLSSSTLVTGLDKGLPWGSSRKTQVKPKTRVPRTTRARRTRKIWKRRWLIQPQFGHRPVSVRVGLYLKPHRLQTQRTAF